MKDKPGSNVPLKPFEAAAASAKIGNLLSGNEGAENFAALDGYMQSQLNPLASEIIKACLPNGLAVPFPANVSNDCCVSHLPDVEGSSLILTPIQLVL